MEAAMTSVPRSASADLQHMNWAGNYLYKAADFVEAETSAHVQGILRSTTNVKAVGTRHAFNHIADTPGTQMSTSRLKSIVLDAANQAVTVGAGVTYGELAPFLEERGFALRNLASLPHISVAGACSTGTHGSGVANGCLSTAVRGLEMVRADGTSVVLSREEDAETFRYAVVSLGALGVLTAITLEVVPTFQVAQTVYENLSFEVLQKDLLSVFGAAYSVSLFTDWQEHRATQVWIKEKLDGSRRNGENSTFFGAVRQRTKLHPLPGISAENCTEQEGLAGAWHERLPHFRMDYTPSAGAELQTEYFVDLNDGYAAIRAVEDLRDRITPHLLVSEFRTVAADDLPLSMAFGRNSLALHFTWKQHVEAVTALLPAIEAKLEPFGARPHWAKLFTVPPALTRQRYLAFEEFRRLAERLDPEGRFLNPYLRELFG